MALYSPHVRRALTSLSTLRRSLSVVAASPGISTPALQSPLLQGPKCAPSQPWALLIKSRSFRTTAAVTLLSARSSYNSNSTEEIGPDTILFEGCDYNHWLIVMDFPKDNKPSPEQMVQTYEETCAKGLNISVEEAKQKMYACSTTTYTGFQAVMTEKESEKFQGLPGVIFVLPDSYIDPVNKEYGGDKYINGIIIPRPPPIQYGRQGRSRDRRYNREGPPMNQGAGDGMNRGAPQNYQSQQNYAPRGPQNYPSQQNYAPGAPQNYPSQQYYAPGAPQNHPSQQNFPPGAPQNYPSRQNYGPPGQGERRDPMLMNQDFGPGGMGGNQLGRGDPIPSHQGNFNSRGQGNYPAQQQRDFRQGDQSPYTPHAQGNFGGASRNYGPPQDGTFGRGASGYQGQGTYGASGPGASSGYGQRPGEDQRFSQEE